MSEQAVELAADETIEGFCRELHPHLEGIVHQYCDEAYGAIMETVQDYLRDNAQFNIKSKFDTVRREYLTAAHALAAVESALTLNEARSNAYAFRKGYWSADRAAGYRLGAEAEIAAARTAPINSLVGGDAGVEVGRANPGSAGEGHE